MSSSSTATSQRRAFGELIAPPGEPGKYNYVSTSPGKAQHLGGELVKMAGVDMVHIAYKGTGAVMPDSSPSACR